MKSRVLAFLCALALILSMIPASAPVAEAVTVASQATGQFMAGFAKICINPTNNVAYPLGGYDDGTGRVPADGVTDYIDDNGDGDVLAGIGGKIYAPEIKLDGLYATAIAVMDEYGSIAIFISMDAISVGTDIVPDTSTNGTGARTRIVKAAKEIGYTIDARSIMVNASHSHSGIIMSGSKTDAYREDLRKWLADVALAALADMKPATISRGSAATQNMNFVRHYHDADGDQSDRDVVGDNTEIWQDGYKVSHVKSCDTNLYFLQFNREGSKDILLVDWRAHPKCNSTGATKWGQANRSATSSDYINTFRYYLEQENIVNSEGYCVAFFQGAAGNINTYSDLNGGIGKSGNPTSAVTSYNGGYAQKGTDYGKKLADYALVGLKSMKAVPTGRVQTATEKLYANQLLIQRDLFWQLLGTKVGSLADTLVSEGYLSSSDANTVKTNSSWSTMRSMSVMEFMSDYYEYGGYYKYTANASEPDIPGNTTDNVDQSNAVVKRVMTALCKHYYLNSKYHLANCYSRRNYKDGGYGTFEVSVFSIGSEIGMMTAPFEIFDSNYQLSVLRSLGLDSVYGRPFVFGYTNIATSYMPDTDAFDYAGSGSYEVNQTYYERGTAERIAQSLVNMLNELNTELPTTCECGEENVVWHPWTPLSTTEVPEGHYYLTADYADSANWRKIVTGKTCLHLNGHTYANASTATGKAFEVNSGAVLNLMGEGMVKGQANAASSGYQTGGVIQVKSGGEVSIYDGVTLKYEDNTQAATPQISYAGGAVFLEGNAKFYMHGGTITGGKTVYVAGKEANGGNVHVSSGALFEMFDGEIIGGYSPTNGGNVYNVGTFIMHDGTISGGIAEKDGGNVYNAGTFTMKEGTITGGQARATADTGRGGNIYSIHELNVGTTADTDNAQPLITLGVANRHAGNVWSAGTMNMYSGTISQGSAGTTSVGGNLVADGAVNLHGGVIGESVSGNNNVHVNSGFTVTLAKDAVVSSMYLNSTSKLNVSGVYTGTAIIEIVGATVGKNIGALQNSGAFGSENIRYKDNTYTVTNSGSNIILAKPSTAKICQIIEADGTEGEKYTSVSDALANYTASAGYIRLLADISGTVNITKDVYLEMNGFDMQVIIGGDAKVYGIERATDDYAISQNEAIGVLTVVSGKPAAECAVTENGETFRYLALPGENGSYTFHRFSLDTKKGLRPYNQDHGTGLYFQPILQADAMVAEAVNNSETVSYGVYLSIDKEGQAPIFEPFDTYNDFEGEVKNDQLRAVVYDLMPNNKSISEAGEDKSSYLLKMDLSGYAVTGQACFKIGEDYILDDADQSISLQAAIKAVDKQYPNLDSAQKAGLDKMFNAYSTVIGSWFDNDDGTVDGGLLNIGNIKVDISDHFSKK